MDSLAQIFGSLGRVKLLRLFLFNRHEGFDFETVLSRAKLSSAEAKTELARLMHAGVVKRSGSTRTGIYRANQRFVHLEALSAFIRSTTVIPPGDLLARVKKAGNVKLVILSGVFTGVAESGADLIVVGDRLDERSLARAAATIEAELGREIRYASFSTDDFSYRMGIYDRLIRDVFDYPHQILLDKIGL